MVHPNRGGHAPPPKFLTGEGSADQVQMIHILDIIERRCDTHLGHNRA